MAPTAVVWLNSGGLDSFIAGKWLQHQGYQIFSLYIHWLVNGTAYNPLLLEAARKSASAISAASHEVFTIEGKLLFGIKNKLPNRPCCSSTMYYAIGCAYAYNLGADYVCSGHKISDKSNYAEQGYFDALEALFKYQHLGKNRRALKAGLIEESSLAGETPIKLLLPLHNKSMILWAKNNLSLKDVKHTYSCAFYPPCGICFKCSRRKRAGLE